MINDLTQKITTSFDQLTQRIHMIETQTNSFDLWTQRIHQIEVNLSQKPNSGPAPQSTTTPTAPGAAPHFGATAAPNQPEPNPPNGNAATFDIGSPLTSNVPANPWAQYVAPGATPPPQNNDQANFDPWSSTQRGRSALPIKPFVEREWSVTDLKPSKELVTKPFTGSAEHYKIWADRIKDHFKERNSDWTFIFKLIESSKSPIWKHSLSQSTVGNSVRCSAVDFQWVTSHLWTFIGKHVTEVVYSRRMTLTNGEEDHGMELWRALFVENEGGAEQVIVGGMNNLHTFPRCERSENLQTYIGYWQQTRMQYGHGLPDGHLRTMFLNILPPAVEKEVRENKDLDTLQKCIDHVLQSLGRYNDSRVAKLHSQRLKHLLSHGQKNPVNMIEVDGHEDRPSNTPVENQPICAISQKLDGLIAALNNQRGGNARKPRDASPANRSGLSRPDPKFEGCWHCGGKCPSRKKCEKFKKLLRDNGGKLPAGYQGAYEKFKAQQKGKTKVAAMVDDVSDDEEFSETEPLFCCMSKSCVPCAPTHMRPTLTSNSFSSLDFDRDDSDSDDEDDEERMVAALSRIATSVKTGPKISQKQKKRPGSQRMIGNMSVAQIAHKIKIGKITLPELDLENNEDFASVWALVDSGAGKSCGNKAKHFPFLQGENTQSGTRMSMADGTELPSRGNFFLPAISAEGHDLSQTFEDADVEMPICAVSALSSCGGDPGSRVIFEYDRGKIVKVSDDGSSSFIKKKGVYFVKLFVPRKPQSDTADSVFSRPGAA